MDPSVPLVVDNGTGFVKAGFAGELSLRARGQHAIVAIPRASARAVCRARSRS